MAEKPVILVVDDDEPILVLMRNILKEFDFEATTASTGALALASARVKPPDLILLDKNMPGMSGGDVIRAFRQDGGAGVPILILSGEPVDHHELEALGADGAIQKPFDLANLIVQIRRYLDQ